MLTRVAELRQDPRRLIGARKRKYYIRLVKDVEELG
jgi:hypothetical protein